MIEILLFFKVEEFGGVCLVFDLFGILVFWLDFEIWGVFFEIFLGFENFVFLLVKEFWGVIEVFCLFWVVFVRGVLVLLEFDWYLCVWSWFSFLNRFLYRLFLLKKLNDGLFRGVGSNFCVIFDLKDLRCRWFDWIIGLNKVFFGKYVIWGVEKFRLIFFIEWYRVGKK